MPVRLELPNGGSVETVGKALMNSNFLVIEFHEDDTDITGAMLSLEKIRCVDVRTVQKGE